MTKKLSTKSVTAASISCSYNRIVAKVKYPSGGTVELRINRNSESVVVGGSSNPEVSRHQAQVIQHWAEPLKDETHAQRAARVLDMLKRYNSVAELVLALEGK